MRLFLHTYFEFALHIFANTQPTQTDPPTPSDYAHKHKAFRHLKAQSGPTSDNSHSAGRSSGSGCRQARIRHRCTAPQTTDSG